MDEDAGPMEVEVKARAPDLGEVRAHLREQGAELVDEQRQEDVYLAHPQRSFAETDEALRVREADGRVHLTYKGPRVDETTKTRQEIDLAIADAGQARRLLASLGFQPAGRVVKRRETYRLAGTSITLDRVEGLGTFVEIETVVEEAVDEAREQVLALADELGLHDRERRSYLELLLEKEGEGGEAP